MVKPSNNHRWVKCEKSGCITITFNYQKTPYKFAPVNRGRYDNPKDIAIANRVASEIEQSVKLGTFEGLEAWKPTLVAIPDTLPTLRAVWTRYKLIKTDKVSKASQVSVWQQTDRCLDYFAKPWTKLGDLLLKLLTPEIAVYHLQLGYSSQVVARVLSDLHAACNLALKRKLIASNPLAGYKDYLPDKENSNRSKECYSIDEVNLIIRQLQTQKLSNRHYASFVEFLFLTGVRPQLAIALTWGDVKADKIIFNKGFTNGELTQGKTGRVTHYPLYPQLKELIGKLYKDGFDTIDPVGSLVFPSTCGNYINLKNFTCRVWKPLITYLVSQGKLTKYLPTYHCRHSTATFLAKAGIPSSTIAALLDTSERMLSKHYFDNQELTKVEIPNLLSR